LEFHYQALPLLLLMQEALEQSLRFAFSGAKGHETDSISTVEEVFERLKDEYYNSNI
jgi:hypothetical protein